MSGNYTYYSDGFFGFGEPGAFKPYTLMHLIPLILCVAAIWLVYRKRGSLKTWKHEAGLRCWLAFAMFSMEFGCFVWLRYVGYTSGQYLMMAKLPLHLCDFGLISCLFLVVSKNRTLFGFNYFVTFFGAVLACVIPQTVLTDVDPRHFRYYQYFGEHLIPIFCTAYMMMVHGLRPRYRDIWITMGVLLLTGVPAVLLNEAFPGSDYLFLRLDISLFPANQYIRLAIYAVLLTAIFHLMWLVSAWSAKRKTSAAGL